MNKAGGLRSQRWQLSFKKNYTFPLKEGIVEKAKGGAKKVKNIYIYIYIFQKFKLWIVSRPDSQQEPS